MTYLTDEYKRRVPSIFDKIIKKYVKIHKYIFFKYTLYKLILKIPITAESATDLRGLAFTTVP